MSTPKEILKKVIAYNNREEITCWLKRYLLLSPVEPILLPPPNYPSPGSFLIDILYESQQEDLLLEFGDAAGSIFMDCLADGSFLRFSIQENKLLPLDICSLTEALPCSADLTESILDALFLVLASNSYRGMSGDEINLRRAILLAIASKIRNVRKPKAELSYLIIDDLGDVEYAVAAYSIILWLNTNLALKELKTVVETLRRGDLTTNHLMFDIAEHLRDSEENREVFVTAIMGLDDTACIEELADHLGYLGLNDLQKKLQERDTTIAPLALLETEIIKTSVKRKAGTSEDLYNTDVKWLTPSRLYGSILNHLEDIEQNISYEEKCDQIGKQIGKRFYSTLDINTKVGVFPNELFGNKIINPLDNGTWKAETKDWNVPNWFTKRRRRLTAAHAFRQAVFDLSKYWQTKQNELQDAISKYTPEIRDDAKDLAHHLNQCSCERPLRMGVSPFFEDQMFFQILQQVTNGISNLNVTKIDVAWGTASGIDPPYDDVDFEMTNELTTLSQRHINPVDFNDIIYKHTGYYVFATRSKIPSNVLNRPNTLYSDKFKIAFDLGLRNFDNGEYRMMLNNILSRLDSKLDLKQSSTRKKQSSTWTSDFELFIQGLTDLYVGGSVNARLLNRIWLPYINDRIMLLCTPNDFQIVLDGDLPNNRVIFGREFINTVKNELPVFEYIAELLRSCGRFLNECAVRAKQGEPLASNVIRHLMYLLAPQNNDYEARKWNFVVSEEDIVALLTEDNHLTS